MIFGTHPQTGNIYYRPGFSFTGHSAGGIIMSFLNFFSKKTTTALTRSQRPSVKQSVDQVYKQAGKQIVDGLNKPTASTGRSMDELHGAAKTIAQMSNIGGGSKATGGKGIAGGLDAMTKYTQAKTAKMMLENNEPKKLGKK